VPAAPFARAALLAPLLALTAGGCYVTHHYRDIEEAPDLDAAGRVSVHVRVVAGEVSLRRGAPDVLYDLHLRYCRAHFAPRVSREALPDGAAVEIDLRRRPRPGERSPTGDERNLVELGLNPSLETDLTLDLGAGRHLADLGGLALRRLDVSTGAGETTLAFERPLTRDLEHFAVAAGPGGLRLRGLGHASAESVQIAAGGGEVEIELDGAWRRDGLIRLDVRLGDVMLEVPRGLGLEVRAEARDPAGLILPEFSSDGRGVYRSLTYDDAARRVTVILDRGLGIFEARLVN